MSHLAARDFLEWAKHRLVAHGFSVFEEVDADGWTCPAVATRTESRIEWFTGYQQSAFAFRELQTLGAFDVWEMSGCCFEAASVHRHPRTLPSETWAQMRQFVCYCVLVVPQLDELTAETVANPPLVREDAALEVPVVAELTTGRLHHYRRSASYDLRFSSVRRRLHEIVGPPWGARRS